MLFHHYETAESYLEVGVPDVIAIYSHHSEPLTLTVNHLNFALG